MKVLSELDKAGKRIDELHTYLEQRDADIKSLRALASDMAQALGQYSGIAGMDCKGTTQYSTADEMLAKYKSAMGEGEAK